MTGAGGLIECDGVLIGLLLLGGKCVDYFVKVQYHKLDQEFRMRSYCR